MKKNINCPICGKLLCKIENNGKIEKAYLYCKRCKKEIYINNVPESQKIK